MTQRDYSDYAIGYLAGFIDGEGSFIISKREHIGYNGKRYIGFSAHLEVTSTDKEVIDWIRETFSLKEKLYLQKQNGNRKTAYRLRLGYKTAKPLVEIFQNHLVIKKLHSEVFMKYDSSSKEEKDFLWEKMKKLNKRGIQ